MAEVEAGQGQDVAVFFLKPFLDYTLDHLGSERMASILERAGVTRGDLEDPTAWVSLQFVEHFCELLAQEHDDPALFDQCGRLAFSERYMGMLRPMVRAFGSPAFAYDTMVRSLPRFNKVGQISVVESGRGLRVMEYRCREGAPMERSPHVCAARAGQMAAIPTLFDRPPALVEHPLCMQRGDPCCLYRISWKERRSGAQRWAMAAGGALAGAGAAALAGLPVSLLATAAVLTGALGLTLGGLLRYRAELGRRVEELAQHNDALQRSAQVNERRFAELTATKAHVEQRVRERTVELQETGARLAEALEQVQELDRAKTRFFANVSHDLRTPLQLILGPVRDMASGEEPPGGQRQALEVMLRNAERLMLLIDQLLQLARADGGPVALRAVSVAPEALVQQVVETFALAARERGVGLEVQGDERPGKAHLDPGWLAAALSNLVSNALRVCPEGGKVTVRHQDTGTDLVFQVEDDGPGIPPGQLEAIFERYLQGGGHAAPRGAIGLGLAVVREAARLHGGDAAAENRPEGGARFTVRIPWVVADASPGEPGEAAHPLDGGPAGASGIMERTARTLERQGGEAPGQGGALRWHGPGPDAPLALVVEDNDDLRRYLGDVLSGRCRVVAAADGMQALELVRGESPEVVVSDIEMPNMSGLELCRALREREETRGVPVLLLTAHQHTGAVLQGYEAGAADYIRKPFHGKELLARVDVQLRLRAMVRNAAHRERLAGVGVLAAEVAHQVRNPLNVIKNGLLVMRERHSGEMDGDSAELLAMIDSSTLRIERLVHNLLSLSGVDRAERRRIRLVESIRSALELVAATLPSGVRLEQHLDEDVFVFCWPRDLGHIFLNLLDNARRAVGEQGTIRIGIEVENGTIRATVDDDGPGIPGEVARILFDPFVTTRPPGEGTGLGLSIARQAADLHGGTLRTEPGPLGGARFVLELPASPEPEA